MKARPDNVLHQVVPMRYRYYDPLLVRHQRWCRRANSFPHPFPFSPTGMRNWGIPQFRRIGQGIASTSVPPKVLGCGTGIPQFSDSRNLLPNPMWDIPDLEIRNHYLRTSIDLLD